MMEKRVFLHSSDAFAYMRKGFEFEKFISEIEALPTLRAKLEKFNEYYDLMQRGMTWISINGGRIDFMLECSVCEGQRKNGCEHHNEKNKEKVWQFIYEKAKKDAQNFKEMPYIERVKAFFERFGEDTERKWGDITGLTDKDYPIKANEYTTISIVPSNEEERLILNTFHLDRLQSEYQIKFEQRKTDFNETYNMRGILNTEREEILRKEKNLIESEIKLKKAPERVTVFTPETNPYTYAKDYNDYFLLIAKKKKIDFSIEPMYEEGKMNVYFSAFFDIEYLEFVKNYTPDDTSKTNQPQQNQNLGKQPNKNQKKFLKAFVEKLDEGHKKTNAIMLACKSAQYSERNGKILDRKVKSGLLKYEPLSAILYKGLEKE